MDYHEIIHWIDKRQDAATQIDAWIDKNLPNLIDAPILYTYEEIQDYLNNPPKKETPKMLAMQTLSGFSRNQIDEMIKNRLTYVM